MDDFKALVSSFIENTTADNEHPRAALISTSGVVRSEDGHKQQLGSPAVVVVTNARLLFVTPDENFDLQEWSVYYSNLADAQVERKAANRVEVQTCDGVQWRCTLPNANPEVIDAVTRHLGWVDRIRTGVLTLEEYVEEAADTVREHADNMDWDAAQEVYQSVRTDLDTLILMVQLTTPMADDTLAPELTDIERTLEDANVRLYIERASSQLELGRYLVEHDDYDRAADVLERARRLHRQAEGQSDAVRRPDAFAFGRQRELMDDIERLEWELKTVAAEPVRQAQEAVIRARETDDPDAAVEYWKTAVRRYDRILDLDWWTEAQEVAEDVDDARAERDQAVEQLFQTHIEVAGERWREGVRNHERSDTEGAIEQFEGAIDHLERAHELAIEFDRDEADDLATQLSEIRENVQKLRRSSTEQSDGSSGDDSSGQSATADAEGWGRPGSRTGSDNESGTGRESRADRTDRADGEGRTDRTDRAEHENRAQDEDRRKRQDRTERERRASGQNSTDHTDRPGHGGHTDSGDRVDRQSPADRTDTMDSITGWHELTDADSGDTEEGIESGTGTEAGTRTASTGGERPAANALTVRLRSKTFTKDTRCTDRWIPPAMSDTATVETHHRLMYDLDEIALPEDVAAGDTGTTDEN